MPVKLPIGSVEASGLETGQAHAHIRIASETDFDRTGLTKIDPGQVILAGKFSPTAGWCKTVSKINLLQKCQKSWIVSVDCFGV